MITLATLHEATEQEVFDQVAAHLLKQNAICRDTNGTCMYRNEAGLKCAAGCLIGDDEYRVAWETSGWKTLVNQFHLPLDHMQLINDLQLVHDTHFVSTWPQHLRDVAERHGLNFTLPS